MRIRALPSIALVLALSSCGGGQAGDVGAVGVAPPAPTPTASPTPAPAPAPTPTPTPPPTYDNRDGQTIVVAEGDSISVDYIGNYTGAYRQNNPQLTYHVNAVAGSRLPHLAARRNQVLERRPDIVTVFVGANDLGSFASGKAYFDDLMAYIQPYHERDIKVLIGTVLPRCANDNQAFNNASNRNRTELAELLKAAIGKQVTAVFDFGGDATMGSVAACSNGQLYKDGLHPTDIRWNGVPGGQAILLSIYEAAMRPVVESVKGQ